MTTKISESEARQAHKGFGVRNILVISSVLAVAAMVVVWLLAG